MPRGSPVGQVPGSGGRLWTMIWLLAIALAQEAADLPGRWYPSAYRSVAEDEGLTAHEREQIRRLEALGYLGGSVPDDPLEGVVRHEPDRSWDGVNLYSSGHRPHAALMAMDGTVLHTWQSDFLDAFPERPDLLEHRSAHTWRRVALLPHGGLLAIHEGLGLVLLDRDSRVVWATLNHAHHDLEVVGDRVWVLTRIGHTQDKGPPVLEDFVAELDLRTGRELRRVSVLHALHSSPYAELLGREPEWETGDLLHTNALHRLDGSAPNPAFSKGRWLISSRTQGFLAVLDVERRTVVWAARGTWSRQHDAEITETGRLLLFDNRGLGVGHSRVLALDPTGEAERVLWSFDGWPGSPLHSDVLGAAQELPNGNVLITESTRGRAVEITPKGQVVWDFHNPRTAEGQYVAAIFELVRLPADAARFLHGG